MTDTRQNVDDCGCPVLFHLLAWRPKDWESSKFFGIVADAYNSATLDHRSIARAYWIANYACNVLVRTSSRVCMLPGSFMDTAPFVWDKGSAKEAVKALGKFNTNGRNGMSHECAYFARQTCGFAIEYHDRAEKFINGGKTRRSYSACDRCARKQNDSFWTSARALSDNYKMRRYNTGDRFLDPFVFIIDATVGAAFFTESSPVAKSREWYTQTHLAERASEKEYQ